MSSFSSSVSFTCYTSSFLIHCKDTTFFRTMQIISTLFRIFFQTNGKDNCPESVGVVFLGVLGSMACISAIIRFGISSGSRSVKNSLRTIIDRATKRNTRAISASSHASLSLYSIARRSCAVGGSSGAGLGSFCGSVGVYDTTGCELRGCGYGYIISARHSPFASGSPNSDSPLRAAIDPATWCRVCSSNRQLGCTTRHPPRSSTMATMRATWRYKSFLDFSIVIRFRVRAAG